jgi:XapX domain-containing protein
MTILGRCVIFKKKVKDMQEVILALVAGLVVGFLFGLIKLPIPAPPALAGVMGIFGVYLGYKLFQWVTASFFG